MRIKLKPQIAQLFMSLTWITYAWRCPVAIFFTFEMVNMEVETTSGASAGVTLLSFLLVGALWGCTNPLIKRGATCLRRSGGDRRPLAAPVRRADGCGMDRFAAAGSATERMYARRDNSARELGKQALHLVKNWRV